MGEERLTWREIMEKYPCKWVGLKDVEWDPNNDCVIKSAVVYRIGKPTDDDWMLTVESKGAYYQRYTTPGRPASVGALMI